MCVQTVFLPFDLSKNFSSTKQVSLQLFPLNFRSSWKFHKLLIGRYVAHYLLERELMFHISSIAYTM